MIVFNLNFKEFKAFTLDFKYFYKNYKYSI